MDNRIPRQDRNGVRTPVDLQRRYKFDKAKEKIEETSNEVSSLNIDLSNKVDKIPGKGLSTNDFNNAYKKKVDDNTDARHKHSNKDVIDNITQEDIKNWDSNGIISSSISDYEGYIWHSNGLLEQWGRVSITPTEANTITSAIVIFPFAYDKAPEISAIPQDENPNIITTSIGAESTEVAKNSMVIYTTRTNTEATMYRWKATGYKKPIN